MTKKKVNINKMLKETPKTLAGGKYDATTIARTFLANDPKREYFTNDSQGHFRLQTMLHLSQMLYCSKTGKPLFKDQMYAYPPRWELLNEENQKKLHDIYFKPSSKINKTNKHQLIYDLYKKQGIEFDASDEELFWGVEEYEKRKKKGLAPDFPYKYIRG